MMELARIFGIIIVTFGLVSCHAQNRYQDLARSVDKKLPKVYEEARLRHLESGIELALYLPKNHSKAGDVDYTDELQKGLNKGGVVLLPDYPLLVNKKGLQLKTGTKLIFRKGSKLIMEANAETHYTVLDIRGVNNVDIYFANIEGDRDRHLISKGEWGMGIRIQGSQDVNIIAPTVVNCWGDGIYISPLGKVESERVCINNFKIHRARRNGISIISGKGITIKDGVISETRGTAPQAAIDIEPNRPSNTLSNILIKDVVTHKSAGDGIMILLSNLTIKDGKSSEPEDKKITIRIENHKDISSQYAARINGREERNNKVTYMPGKLGGEITFTNPTWQGYRDRSPIRYSPSKTRILNYGFNPNISFDNVTLHDDNGVEHSNSKRILETMVKEAKKL